MKSLGTVLPLAGITIFFGLFITASGARHDVWFGNTTAALASGVFVTALAAPASWRPLLLIVLALPWAYFMIKVR